MSASTGPCIRTPQRPALLHVRNEHAIVQYWINSALLADGVARFGQMPELDWIADFEGRHRFAFHLEGVTTAVVDL